MKDDYLKRLSNSLDYYNIENKEEVLEKYKKRYEFGLESGLDPLEIEKRLGDPVKVAEELSTDNTTINNESNDNTDNTKKANNFVDGYNLIVKTVADEIVISESKNNEINIKFENTSKESYDVITDVNKGIKIDYHKTKYFSLNRKPKGKIIIELPNNITFDKITISTTSGNISINELKSKELDIVIVSSRVDFKYLSSSRVKLQTVSGEISGYQIDTNDLSIHTISGDIMVTTVESEIIKIDTVSGDVKISKAKGQIKTSSVTGDIIVDGVIGKSFKNMVKGVFK